jgi:hypothetical protein
MTHHAFLASIVEDCRAFLRSEALAHRAAQLGWGCGGSIWLPS